MNAATHDPDLQALQTDAGRRNPYPFYHALRARPPVYDERHGGYLVTKYRDCEMVLTNRAFGRPDTSYLDSRIPRWRDYPGLVRASRAMQFASRADHQRLRTAVAGYFSARRVVTLLQEESRSVDGILDTIGERLDAGEVVDLRAGLCDRVPSMSICALFGISEGEFDGALRDALALSVLEPGVTVNRLEELDHAYDSLGAYFESIIADRRKNPADDLSTHLVMACDTEKRIRPGELASMFIAMYVAGTVNTSNFLSNGLAALLEAPAQAAHLREQPALGESMVVEILRYDAPMQVTRRIASEDQEVGGTAIRAGEEIAVAIGAANRDPSIFPEPDTFRIQRTGAAPLSFGAGPFHCLGAALGRFEGALVFSSFARRFPHLQPAAPPTHNMRSVLRGYACIPARLAGHGQEGAPC